MIPAGELGGIIFPVTLLALVAAASWYNVFRPPYVGRVARLRRLRRRRRALVRWYFLTAALGSTIVLAVVFYDLLTGQW
jgi:hypothetical protein